MKKEQIQLFQDKTGNPVSYGDIKNALYDVGADCCDVLMLHTELSFGIPNKDLRRKEILRYLHDIFMELDVKTLLIPTFTFSFSNNQPYDINNSRTTMGTFNEFLRKQSGAVRSIDPQMSFSVIGDHTELVKDIGKECIGAKSTFDKMHNTKNVKILFFGTSIDQCFTHQHYVEWVKQVPYRYNLEFTGTIIDENGTSFEDTYSIFVKYRDIIPYTPPSFTKSLLERGVLHKVNLGNTAVYCFTEEDAFNETRRWIENDVNAFLGEPYNTKPLIKEYSYGNVTTVQ